METQRVPIKEGVLPWLVLWACRAGTREFCPPLAALAGSTEHYVNSFVPIVQQAGQAVVVGLLSLTMCLWFW